AMHLRALRRDDTDQLWDGETGSGVPPLQAHLRECDECRAAYEEERQVVEALEHLPRLAPSPEFASRVMSQVQIYEPWHVAARDTVLGWIRPLAPRSQPVRPALGGAALSPAAPVSGAAG